MLTSGQWPEVVEQGSGEPLAGQLVALLAIGDHAWGVTLAALVMLVSAILAMASLRRRSRRYAPDDSTAWHELVHDCESVSIDVMDLVVADDGDRLRDRWSGLHARLVELEWRSASAANAMGDSYFRRTLDQLAAALIALRGALEADVRLRLDPAAAPTLRTAGDDVVIVRCEDLMTTVRALESRPA